MEIAAFGLLADETRADPVQIVRAALITKDTFDLSSIYSQVEKLAAVPILVLLTV